MAEEYGAMPRTIQMNHREKQRIRACRNSEVPLPAMKAIEVYAHRNESQELRHDLYLLRSGNHLRMAMVSKVHPWSRKVAHCS